MIKLNSWLISAWKANVSTPAAAASASAILNVTSQLNLTASTGKENDQRRCSLQNERARLSGEGRQEGESESRSRSAEPQRRAIAGNGWATDAIDRNTEVGAKQVAVLIRDSISRGFRGCDTNRRIEGLDGSDRICSASGGFHSVLVNSLGSGNGACQRGLIGTVG